MTDGRRLAGPGIDGPTFRDCLLQQVAFAVEAGVDVVQIRERNLATRDLVELVERSVALARGSATRIVVNDRLDVALACRAAGVHLRGDSPGPAVVRRAVPDGFLVGRSVHGLEEACQVAPQVDYLIAGTVWATESKPHPLRMLGLAGLAAIAAAVNVPVLAIGGMQVGRIGAIADSGAAGIAGIGVFQDSSADRRGCRATTLRETAKALRAEFGGPRYH